METVHDETTLPFQANGSQRTMVTDGIGNDSAQTELSPELWGLNSSNNTDNSGRYVSVRFLDYPGMTELYITLNCILWLFCVVGNSLVLTVMMKSPALRTRTNLFLSHLAVADLSVGLVCIIPNVIVAKIFVWFPGPGGTFLCKVYNFFEEFSMTVSVLLLVLIAVERYVAIIHPLKVRTLFTRCRMYTALVAIWIAACLYNTPLLYIYITFDTGSNTYCFRHDTYDQPVSMELFVLCSFLFTYLIPLLLMVSMYLRISLTLWRSSPANVLQQEQTAERGGPVATEEAAKIQKGAEDDGRPSDQKTAGRPDGQNSSKAAEADCSVNTGNKTCPYTQPVTGDNSKGCTGRERDEAESRTTSSTSHTSCSSAYTASTSTAEDQAAAAPTDPDRSDKAVCRPLLRAHRSDVSPLEDGTVTKGQGGPLDCSHPSPSKRQRGSAEALGGGDSSGEDPRGQVSSRMTSSASSVPLLSPPASAGGGSGGGGSSATASGSAPMAAPQLATSGSRDGVYVLKPGQKKTSSGRYRVTSNRVLLTRRKVVRLLITVLSAFAICVLPFHVRALIYYWKSENTVFTLGALKYISQHMFFLNSALNPVLYSLMSDSFRRSARQVLCCSKTSKRRDVNAAGFVAGEVRAHHLVLHRTAASRPAALGP